MKNLKNNQPKVAVVGASGIGKNHARWFHQHGCEVVAFVGSSPDSVARTQQVLTEGFGFSGHGYAGIQMMLEEAKPDIVCVSSPSPQHFAQVMACLQNGAHVLCEKPLVYDPELSSAELIAQANQLVEEAKARDLVFGTQMQYGPATTHLLQVAGVAASEVRDYEMVMETKNIKDERTFEQIWIDLSPHPLSVLQKLAPNGEPQNIRATISERETQASFSLQGPNGPIEARITVRFDPQTNPPQRYFAFNGKRVGYTGRKNTRGEFVSFLTAPDGSETELPDLVDLLIGEFVRACKGQTQVPVSGAEGAQNVAWQLKIKDERTKT
jgi:predicted dehydrogenase